MGLHDGNVALVTGAASGIGRAAAERFAAEGARVVVVDIDEPGGLETVQRIEGAGGTARFLRVDVTDEIAVEQMVAQTVERFGRLDCALNNAGTSDPARAFVDLEAAVWNRMIAIDLTSVFFCMKHELRQMLRQERVRGRRGAIVNTASGASIVPAPGQPHYTAAKHGVLGLTKIAAQEYYAQGIRTNAICPGLTDTGLVRAFLASSPPKVAEQVRRSVPGGELGRPEDVAAAAVWLASDEARWVNGDSLIVDGGGVLR